MSDNADEVDTTFLGNVILSNSLGWVDYIAAEDFSTKHRPNLIDPFETISGTVVGPTLNNEHNESRGRMNSEGISHLVDSSFSSSFATKLKLSGFGLQVTPKVFRL